MGSFFFVLKSVLLRQRAEVGYFFMKIPIFFFKHIASVKSQGDSACAAALKPLDFFWLALGGDYSSLL
jgi:hypothetical protein